MTRKQRFRFSLLPVTAFLLVFLLLLWLGSWQWHRGEEKQALHDAFASTAQSLSANDMSLAQMNAAGIYRNIEICGRYLGEYQFLLDNMTEQGQAGYHVLTPMAVSGREWIVIVDRGWIPKDFTKNALPEVRVSGMQRCISGKLSPLPAPGLLLEGETAANGWPRVVQFTSTTALADSLPSDVQVVEQSVLLSGHAADGFVRDWKPPGLSPERHYAYAFQWFALALALLTIILVLVIRGRREHSEEP